MVLADWFGSSRVRVTMPVSSWVQVMVLVVVTLLVSVAAVRVVWGGVLCPGPALSPFLPGLRPGPVTRLRRVYRGLRPPDP
ncbi:hypothetical protein GCM10010357_36750 [Streptomyces luteireticuli]|uniref:Uncharacterized protein n=1 Tax=Streptomyces luteireticuli TaxID=173858 RepID=A0ABN0YV65_9ACTN